MTAETADSAWDWAARWAEVRSTLDQVADRMDEHAYSELSCLLDDEPGEPDDDALQDLLGRQDDDALIAVIAAAVSDAQTYGHVEYKRRVGLAGRRTIAETVLWRLREHLSTPPASTDGSDR